jgi:hypothetical protein
MGTKRNKVTVGIAGFVPDTINFSDMEEFQKQKHNQQNGEGYDADIQISDGGLAVEQMEQDMHFEELIIQMLYVLEGNERTIFLYQLLRDYGYQIDHTSFARTLRLKRSRYMDILSMVRLKTYLVVKGYRESQEAQSKQTKVL